MMICSYKNKKLSVIRYYELDEDGYQKMEWELEAPDGLLGNFVDVELGDLDGDGDIDVAATSWRNPGRVVWFENHGDPRSQWTRHMLKNNWRSANQVIIADLNGDGRLDIVSCAEHGSYELRWWRNEGRPEN